MEYAALIGAVGSVIGVLYLLRTNKRHLEANTTEAQSRAASALTTSYEAYLTRTNVEIVDLRARISSMDQQHQAELAAMEARLSALEKHNRQLTVWSQLLFTQVVESGGTPIPFEKVP